MAWEDRGNGRYYYRKRWRAGQVVTEYVGAGLVGQLAAHGDAQAQAKREAGRRQLQQLMARDRDIDQGLDQMGDMLRELTTGLLLVGGYHTHKGQWRKVRGKERAGAGG